MLKDKTIFIDGSNLTEGRTLLHEPKRVQIYSIVLTLDKSQCNTYGVKVHFIHHNESSLSS